MVQHEMLAMILAGGRGSRLHELTTTVAKPAVSFGGKYRIIDFPLSNCANSGISVVGVMTQYENIFLNSYVAHESHWGLDARNSGIFVLPPRETNEGFGVYRGTADAITQNIDFIDSHNPEYILILSGDHIYKMDYSLMLDAHKQARADATIAVLEVPLKEASRFGIMNVDKNDMIIEFEEKPAVPKSNLASMGIYIFSWKPLRKALIADAKNDKSSHDFGKDIIPAFLNEKKVLKAYRFEGYWKDVGTIESLWEANMDLLDPDSGITVRDHYWRIYTEDKPVPPQYVGKNADVKNSMINQGAMVFGKVKHSIIFDGCIVEEGAEVIDSVLLANVVVKSGVSVRNSIVMESLELIDGCYGSAKKISLVHDQNAGRSK